MVRHGQSSASDEIPAIPALTDPSQNPYYVHPNESVTAALVSPPLDGKNYHAWSKSMMKAVIMKNKLCFMDGSCPMPDPFDPTYEPWIRCNNLVLSWLMNSVILAISQSLVYTDTAAQAWIDLKARFSRADRVRVSTLQREMYALRQDSSSVTEFFTKLKGLWQELELYRPIPNCTCTFQCVCEAMRNAKKFREEDLILLFLTGLNEQYVMVRSQILLMEPFPQLNAAFGMVIQHESLDGLDTTLANDQEDQVSAAINFARKPNGKGFAPPKNDKLCTFCHKTNHVVDNCFKKHGFPPGYRFRDGTVVGNRTHGNSVNHIDGENAESKSIIEDRVATFSSEEYQALMALLKSKNAGEGPSQVNNIAKCVASSYCNNDKQGISSSQLDTCIIDSGATDHVCASLSLFSSYRQVNVIPVKLPNGSIVSTDIIGNITLTSELEIKNVFLCYIQNSMQKMIGSGRMINGLFYLEGTQFKAQTVNKMEFCCDICHFAKQKKFPYSASNSRAIHCLELLHMDIWGPFSTPTTHGHKYFLTVMDDFSRFTWVILLKGKYEAASKIQDFIQYSENHFGHKVKFLRSDNGPEFLSLSKFYLSKGIQHQTSCVYTPQQNGRVERKHQCILNIARALLTQSNLPSKYSGYAVLHSVFIMNRVPSQAIQNKIPFAALHNKLPDMSQLKVFGSLCYASTHDVHRSKFDHRARKCVYLGIKSVKSITNSPQQATTHSQHDITDSSPTSTHSSIIPTRHTTRTRKPPSHLVDYHCSSITAKTPYPISKFVSHANLSDSYSTFCLSLLADQEPNNYAQASQHECWVKAMKDELTALANNHTWVIVDLPKNVKPIGSKWVYKLKRKTDGSIDRYKARLVAKGYNQIEGVDYFQTFSPVAKLTTIRIVLAVASIKHWHIHQLDVDNAFLHGDLAEEVYMSIPQGLEGTSDNQVCKLTKSLYGLKQASRQWYEKLSQFLTTLGYAHMPSDPTLFTKQTKTSFTTLLVYVDDIVLTGDSLEEIEATKAHLNKAFGIKDIGILKYFLGLEVAHSQQGITLCQRKYCLDLLTETGSLGCKPSSVPMDPSIRLHHDDSEPHTDITEYRALVGKLLYLTSTRPDIAFSVQQLSQFLDAPTMIHFKAAHKVLRYLKDSRRSITGYCFYLGQSLICWKAKKQLTVSKSSSEAEYRALASTTCELQWLSYLLRDLKIHPAKGKLQGGLMKLLPITGYNQLADVFTKALHPANFHRLFSKLGLHNIFRPQLEGV
ncbi:hypothetical protein TSUD_319450 [Trifolium subterraneum]|uniref:Integrase catalytic domain-containing protein n=1 Tax=Trifolium subterraneum TaxID=3900 RepID=A0A2Z6M134_TRISU|nr:hypothetical protein TSUD_319450 [Trifolium subterraneum]